MADRRHASNDEAAHDVLAAEEFVVPARDPGLHHGPVALPEDPSGIAEPHDVLAAEEFALPAGRSEFGGQGGGLGSGGRGGRTRAAVALGAAALVALLMRKRHR
jgi:hypothetical protein